MLIPSELQVVGRNVNLRPLDPETLARFYAANEHLGWQLAVVSAARTKAQQRYLYRGYKTGKPGFNLAANPDWQRPDGTYGSRHMVQATGHSYALDLRRTGPQSWPHVHAVLHQFGLRFTVPGEAWHAQALEKFLDSRPVYWPIDDDRRQVIQSWRDRITAADPEFPPNRKGDGWAAVAQFVAACRQTVIRRGDEGPVVRFAQQALNAADTEIAGQPGRWPTLTLDGKFGPATENAVRTFQGHEGLAVDGVVGPKSWSALLD